MTEKFIILAAIDLNQGSAAVVEQALTQAKNHDHAEVHVLVVREPQQPVAMYPVSLVPAFETPSPEETLQFCRDLLKDHPTDQLPPSLEIHATLGLPADEIVWFAAHINADLIVMGTHGRRGLKRLLMGSVAEKVVRFAGCPVIVVRQKAHDPTARVPEIEPLCPDCATKRAETNGAELWCARHSEHHVRAHVRSYTAVGSDPPHAWSSSTGT
ncbi:MAG: universal stress protein [Myxococcales bacterium]|nr:universal stress protein [Myxococcales bacterium]